MSYTESPEQRQIRELRGRISYMESQLSGSSVRNLELENMLAESRRQLAEANAKLEGQTCRMDRLDRQLTTANANILALDKEIKEKEELQRRRIADMKAQYDKELKEQKEAFDRENRNLQDSIASTRQEMRQSIEIVRAETDRKLQDQETRIQAQMNEVARELDTKIENIIQDLKAEKDGEKELAEYWTEQANRLIDDIMERPRGELFSGKELSRYVEQLGIAVADLKNGRYSSAADGARAVFYDTLDLKERVLEAELEWNAWYNAIKEKEIQLIEALRAAENREYQTELDDLDITDNNGIDYWTRGQLTVVRERIEALQREMEGIEKKPTEYLRQQMEELQALQEELALVENASHTNFAMAVERFRMANHIGEILGESYNMIDADGDYFAEEPREAYHAIYENPVTGDQAAVVSTPIYGDDGIVTNHIELLIGNANNDPVARTIINDSVVAQLHQNGYTDISFPCVNQHGSETRAEVSRVGNIEEVTAGEESVRAKM